jgi:hypothetical protein
MSIQVYFVLSTNVTCKPIYVLHRKIISVLFYVSIYCKIGQKISSQCTYFGLFICPSNMNISPVIVLLATTFPQRPHNEGIYFTFGQAFLLDADRSPCSMTSAIVSLCCQLAIYLYICHRQDLLQHEKRWVINRRTIPLI